MTLTDFLLARVAEDEAYAQANARALATLERRPGHRSRVLAECEAKRRIIETFSEFVGVARAARLHEEKILRLLALPYADHPDYPEEKGDCETSDILDLP